MGLIELFASNNENLKNQIVISVKKYRAEKDLTQDEFANLAGITRTFISQIETDYRLEKQIRLDSIEKIVKLVEDENHLKYFRDFGIEIENVKKESEEKIKDIGDKIIGLEGKVQGTDVKIKSLQKTGRESKDLIFFFKNPSKELEGPLKGKNKEQRESIVSERSDISRQRRELKKECEEIRNKIRELYIIKGFLKKKLKEIRNERMVQVKEIRNASKLRLKELLAEKENRLKELTG